MYLLLFCMMVVEYLVVGLGQLGVECIGFYLCLDGFVLQHVLVLHGLRASTTCDVGRKV